MSPAERVEWSAALIAAMPDPNACAASAPSSSAMTRFSSSTVGLRKRAYVKPYSSSAMTAPSSETRSKEKVVEATIGPTTGSPAPSGSGGEWIARVERPSLRLLMVVGPARAAPGAYRPASARRRCPAAAAPSRSVSPSPTCSTRSGSTPSRSRATRKAPGSGFAAPASAELTIAVK